MGMERKESKFYVYPHPGRRMLFRGFRDPSVDPFTEYRGAVIKTQDVFEHAYIFVLRVEPTVSMWRVFHGTRIAGMASVQKSRRPLFML